MAAVGDLIDFNVIEGQKENIAALPSGRSAKTLVQRFSPVSVASPADTEDVNAAARVEYEQELLTINDSDDPLDIYDRYVRWTLDAYPSVATGQSQLLPLLERATKAFLKDDNYKNDPRYLKLWLNYIRLFSDTPRETFAYLARHEIGTGLALYYEEFAAWLENAARFTQAEEIYKLGIERQARPAERLLRKFGEFKHRAQAKLQDAEQPSSPALPVIRPALGVKLDPFSISSTIVDPQAADRARAAAPITKRQKMRIFTDDGVYGISSSGERAGGSDNLATVAERRRENVVLAQAWDGGQTGIGMKLNSQVPKMEVFKDTSTQSSTISNQAQISIPVRDRVVPTRNGKVERVFVNLELVYPNPDDPSEEYCFEELRAASRGWTERDWRKEAKQSERKPQQQRPRMPPTESTTTLIPLAGGHDEEAAGNHRSDLMLRDENGKPLPSQSRDFKAARRFQREERANRTRNIRIKESRTETQTIQTNLDSPRGPKLRRKKSTEPTMTIHTKAATDEVYELFNQSLSDDEEHSDDTDIASSSEEGEDDDGYTTGGESTGTGRISGTTSEIGEETERELDDDRSEAANTTGIEPTEDNTGWSEFTTSKHMPKEDDTAGSVVEHTTEEPHDTHELRISAEGRAASTALDEHSSPEEEVKTPTSPELPSQDSHRFVPVQPEDYHAPTRPYRNPDQVAANRLPFMTPIVEKTESSFGTLTKTGKDYFTSKTPCPKASQKTPQIAEDDDEVWSSPFQETGALQETSRYNIQSTTTALSPQAKVKPAPAPTVKATKSFTKKTVEPAKGPIIKDAQCNPMAPDVHETILREMQPPLSSYEGFFDRRDNRCGRKPEIHKYCRSVAASKAKHGSDKTLSTLRLPPMLRLGGAKQQYAIKRELGAGAFAPVYLAEALTDVETQDADEASSASVSLSRQSRPRPTLQALKMEDPPSAWEFYMLQSAHRRLGVSRPSQSIIQAYEMHLFADEGYLFEEYRDQGTLLDLVNVVAEQNRQAGTTSPGMDECLAMFFAIEILRTVEALHAKSIIHGDLKADNVLVRFVQPENETDVSSSYARDGSAGWSAKGITLIDFGRGIDMRHFSPNVQFIADWPTSETDCAEMRELRPWTYQADYHGIAAIAHTMLFGKYIETVAEKGGIGAGAAKTYRLREGLKRWWQGDIWGEFFALMLNPTRYTEREDGGKMPVTRGLREVREKMEVWLEGNEEKGVGLRNWIRRLEGVLVTKRRC